MYLRLFLFFFIFFDIVSISQVNFDTIKTVAKNFFKTKIEAYKKSSDIEIEKIYYVKNFDTIPEMFFINLKPEGFIIVSNDYSSVPIIGYSFSGKLEPERVNLAFEWWIKQKSKEIFFLRKTKNSYNIKWKEYYNKKVKSTKGVYPLLITKWDQGKYYNSMCPIDPNGPDGHCLTGCVATAVSQIMYYYRWPNFGTGCFNYYHPNYGEIGLCFDTCFFNYNEMPQVLSDYNKSVALLMFATGVSFSMDYGPYGSGVWNHSVANSLKNFFKYGQNTRYIFRDSTNLNWDSLIISNLEKRKPLYYAAWEDTTFTSGHAFVCDGYQDTGYYHFNWGWGGYADGYYYTNQLNPGGYNFSFCHELIVDIYPDTLNYHYPSYCNNDTITFNTGTITLNNGTKKYLKNSNCTWLISPECGSKIFLQFNSFNISYGDTLFIYDGENETTNILDYFTFDKQPILISHNNATTLISSTNKVFIKFKSDDEHEDYGFNLFFKTYYCGTDTLIEPYGIISDGSGSCNYKNLTNCKWVIKPDNAQYIVLNFTSFKLATNNNGDFLSIYKNNLSYNNLIAKFDAFNPPTEPILVPSGIAIIRFITNSSYTDDGWEAYYETLSLTQNNKHHSKIIIFPNPICSNSIIFSNDFINEITLTDMTGKKLFHFKIQPTKQVKIYDFIKELKPGIYFLITNSGITKLISLPSFE